MQPEPFILQPFDKEGNFENGNFYKNRCVLPPHFRDIQEQIRTFKVKEDDVWLVSFPRTGSTWCQEMVWLIQNNLDFATAQTKLQQLRAPLIESSIVLFEYKDFIKHPEAAIEVPRFTRIDLPLDLLPPELGEVKNKLAQLFTDPVGFVDSLKTPRCIKSHLPLDLLPEGVLKDQSKIIYTMRNPKDLCVSFYFHCQMVHKLDMPFEAFCELFLNDALPIGSVFKHYLGFWKMKDQPNVLLLTYEEMKRDTKGTVKKIGGFLGKSLTEEDVDAVCEFLSFQNMRDNKACNLQVLVDNNQGNEFYKKSGKHFIRKGIVGDHKNHMSPELEEKFDKWIEESTRGTGLKF